MFPQTIGPAGAVSYFKITKRLDNVDIRSDFILLGISGSITSDCLFTKKIDVLKPWKYMHCQY